MNSLDEAISHAEEVANEKRFMADHWTKQDREDEWHDKRQSWITECKECAEDHEQLAAWLKELKDYREGKRTCENCKHQNKAEDQYPCSICRNNHPNMFEWAKESEATND